MNKKYNCMNELEMFSALTDSEKTCVYDVAKGIVLKKGDFLFNQGDKGENIFLVQKGKVMIEKYTSDGRKIILEILKSGDLICETILFDELDYPFSAVALENSYICACSKEDVANLIKDPIILKKIFSSINKKMNDYTERMTNSALKDVQDKVYGTLKQISEQHGVQTEGGIEIDCYLSHEDIAFMVNASRVSVTRSIKDLISRGRLDKQNRHYVIC